MSTHQVTISIDREDRSVKPGAVRSQEIINLAQLDPGERLMLEVFDDIDIPLSAEDLIFIRGGEKFSIGSEHPEIQDNPRLRKHQTFVLNDIQVSEHQQLHHAKLTGFELKALVGGHNVDLWIDLDDIADVLTTVEN